MRVQLDNNHKTVDLEHNPDMYKTAEADNIFLTLVRDALLAIGYSEVDLLAAWKKKDEE